MKKAIHLFMKLIFTVRLHEIDIRPMFKASQDASYDYNTPNIITEKYINDLFS